MFQFLPIVLPFSALYTLKLFYSVYSHLEMLCLPGDLSLLSLSLIMLLALNSTLSDINIATPVFFSICLVFFHPFAFNLYVDLCVPHISVFPQFEIPCLKMSLIHCHLS